MKEYLRSRRGAGDCSIVRTRNFEKEQLSQVGEVVDLDALPDSFRVSFLGIRPYPLPLGLAV